MQIFKVIRYFLQHSLCRIRVGQRWEKRNKGCLGSQGKDSEAITVEDLIATHSQVWAVVEGIDQTVSYTWEHKHGLYRPGKLMLVSQGVGCWKDNWEMWGHL